MLVDFKDLGSDARIWIYQSDRKFDQIEIDEISKLSSEFVKEWTAHGQGLQGSYKIVYDQFLIIGVDENFNRASGCSIDTSVKFIQSLENQFNLSLSDRSKVAILIGDEVFIEDFRELKEKVKKSEMAGNAKTFNNYITTKKELDEAWLSPIQDSWLKKYL